MNAELLNRFQAEVQAATGPLQDLWTNSPSVVIAAGVVAGLFVLMVAFGSLRGAIKRSHLKRQIASSQERIRDLGVDLDTANKRADRAGELARTHQGIGEERQRTIDELNSTVTALQESAADSARSYQSTVDGLNSEKEQLAANYSQTLQALQAENAEKAKQSEETVENLRKENAAALEDLQKKSRQALSTERDVHRQEVADLNEQKKLLESQLSRSSNDGQQANTKLREEITGLKAQISGLISEKAAAEARAADLESKSGATSELRKKLEEANQKTQSMRDLADELATEKKQAEAALVEEQVVTEQLRAQIQELSQTPRNDEEYADRATGVPAVVSGQLGQVESYLNQAIELLANRDPLNATIAISNAAALTTELRNAAG
jgi:chromosome segregation ATPase